MALRTSYPCPECGTRSTSVHGGCRGDGIAVIVRRRQCRECHARWTTYEINKSDYVDANEQLKRERRVARAMRRALDEIEGEGAEA